MRKQMRVGVKAALITAVGAIITTLIIVFFSKSNSDGKKENNISQGNTQSQSTVVNLSIAKDTGTIESSKAEPKENIVYKVPPLQNREIQKKQAKNEIINNAPNQGLQINENNGTVVLSKPLQRNFTTTDGKNILKDYPFDFPIEIWLKGTNTESRTFFNQIVNTVKSLGFNNISTNIIGLYGTTEIIEKDFQYGIEGGKFIFSIYLQQ